jgi:uncharacterized protein (TIRG00374 family)
MTRSPAAPPPPRTASLPLPGGPVPGGMSAGPGSSGQRQRATRSWRRVRAVFRRVAPAAVVVAVFGFALPRFASYRSVWARMQAMPWPDTLLAAAAALISLVCCWVVICAVLPAVRLRQAAVVNLSSTAVANTLPAGGALAMGVSWTMLRGYGVSTADYVLYSLLSGIWSSGARLVLPVLAVLLMMTTARPPDILIAAAAVGLVLITAAATGLFLLVRSESFVRLAAPTLARAAALGCKLARRPPPAHVAESLAAFRAQAATILATRGWRLTAATAVGQITAWLVLLACLRGIGLSQAQIPWQTSLAAFTFIRLLTALPITPGGLGVTELGLVGVLTAGADHRATIQVTAAVLVYRAISFLPSIPLGAAAGLAWRYTPRLIHASPGTGGRHHDDPARQDNAMNGDREQVYPVPSILMMKHPEPAGAARAPTTGLFPQDAQEEE